MKKPLHVAVLLSFGALSFVAGVRFGGRATSGAPPGSRKVLYYVDPMHPAYRSEKPGIAPDCGMPLEPVYEDGGQAGASEDAPSRSLPAGAVQVSPARQQLVGLRTGVVEKAAGAHTIRTVGRVAADESRIHRLTTGADGYIREIFPNSAGTLVRKNELLASFYSTTFLTAQQAFIYGLGTVDRFKETGPNTPQQIELTNAQVRSGREALRNLGVSEVQIQAIADTRKPALNVEVRAPVTGFVLARNVSIGQRFEASTELYRIADLSRVWILADLPEDEALYVRPGLGARVLAARGARTFSARVSNTLPQFDPNSRTMKVRLDVDNPGYALRPDMFVDVEFPVALPPALTVPNDAVLDSGLRKTVFIDRGDGHFEPRSVETGWRLGDRVEIVRGLMEGEKIVVSGNFLIDSESRMKAAAMGITGAAIPDPVCGMDVDEVRARAAGRTIERGGRTYAFCSDNCKRDFEKDPDRYAGGR